jgi:hypothetical protein
VVPQWPPCSADTEARGTASGPETVIDRYLVAADFARADQERWDDYEQRTVDAYAATRESMEQSEALDAIFAARLRDPNASEGAKIMAAAHARMVRKASLVRVSRGADTAHVLRRRLGSPRAGHRGGTQRRPGCRPASRTSRRSRAGPSDLDDPEPGPRPLPLELRLRAWRARRRR